MSSERDYEQEYYSLLESFKWCAAILNVIVQEEGGIVEIDKATAQSIDLAKNVIQVRDEDDKYIVESVEVDDAV